MLQLLPSCLTWGVGITTSLTLDYLHSWCWFPLKEATPINTPHLINMYYAS